MPLKNAQTVRLNFAQNFPEVIEYRISRSPRPRVDGDDDALARQNGRLPRLDPDLRNLLLGRNEDLPDRSGDRILLQDAAILAPLPANDRNDAAGRRHVLRFRRLLQHFGRLVVLK